MKPPRIEKKTRSALAIVLLIGAVLLAIILVYGKKSATPETEGGVIWNDPAATGEL